MIDLGTVLAAEVPVSTILLGGMIGHFWRSAMSDNERRDTDLARQSEALAILVAAQQPIDGRLAQLERRASTLSEATAGLSATLEAHEWWHERHTVRNEERAAHP